MLTELTDERISWHFVLTGSSFWAGRGKAVEKELNDKNNTSRDNICHWFLLNHTNIYHGHLALGIFNPNPGFAFLLA